MTEAQPAGLPYEDYLTLVAKLAIAGGTTGPKLTEDRISSTRLNWHRMTRLDKTVTLSESLRAALKRVTGVYDWVVLSESWCGDAGQIVPILHMVEQACPAIRLKILLRDEHPALMDRYLTNGARAIPKLICYRHPDLMEVAAWGPRPATLQALVIQLRQVGADKETRGLALQKWYNENKTRDLQEELARLVVDTHVI